MTDNPTPCTPPEFGKGEGNVCWRNGCQGVIAERPVENCRCHICPPCSACTTPREYCPKCNWCAEDDHETVNDYVMTYKNDGTRGILGTATIAKYEPRPLDLRKLDWRSKSHTHFSMIKEGVYPPGMTREEVEKEVRGTFGGRFNKFGNGKFEYVAYTD